MFKMGVQTRLVAGCCRGWRKRSPQDTDCLEPQCKQQCRHGGQCIGPDMCVCPKGYGGRFCETDIDECAGRNSCQHKCTNVIGSYVCSCSEGFKLANDNTSCDLCLACTSEFRMLQDQMSSLPEEKAVAEAAKQSIQADMRAEMKRQAETFDKLQDQYDTIVGIQKQIDVLPEMSARLDNLTQLQAEVSKLRSLDTRIVEVEDRMDDGMAEMKASYGDLVVSVESATEGWQKDAVKFSKQQALAVEKFQEEIDKMAARIDSLEKEKEIMKSQLVSAEAAVSALKVKEVTTTQEPVTSLNHENPYDAEGIHMPLDRLASLSQQISILEARMSDCLCGQDYYG